MSGGTTKLEVRVQHLDCENEAAKIEAGLRGHEGVVEVRTFPKAGKVSLMFEPAKTSREASGAISRLASPITLFGSSSASGIRDSAAASAIGPAA